MICMRLLSTGCAQGERPARDVVLIAYAIDCSDQRRRLKGGAASDKMQNVSVLAFLFAFDFREFSVPLQQLDGKAR
jgi:hypothetical protein